MQVHVVAWVGLSCALSIVAAGQPLRAVEKSDDASKEEKITYDDHIQPIFRQKCASCHNPDKQSSGLDLSSYTSLMQGGSSGDAVDPGSPDGSYLYLLVTHDSEPAMPPESERLPDESLDLIGRWIEQGALENSGSKPLAAKKPRVSLALTESPTERPATVPMPGRLEKEPLVTSSVPGVITALATSPWAPVAAVAGQRQVLLYHTETEELLGILPFPEGVPYALRFSRNGKLLLAGGGQGGASGRVVVWELSTGRRVFEVGDELDAVLAADINADQTLIALGGPQKVVRVYATSDGSLQFELRKHTDWIRSLEFSPDGVLLASGDRAGNLLVWEGFTGREYLDLKGHSDALTGVSWRADSNILASAGEDGSVRLWELENGNQVRNWNAHGGGVTSLEFTRDGRIVTTGRDRTSKLWAQDGKQQQQFGGFADITVRTSFCDETNRAVIADWTGAIRLFPADEDAAVGELVANPPTLTSRLMDAQERLAQHQEKLEPLQAVFESAEEKQIVAREAAESARAAHETAAVQRATLQDRLEKLDGQSQQLQQEGETVRTRLVVLTSAGPKLQQAARLLEESATELAEFSQGKDLASAAAGAKRLSQLHSAELSEMEKRRAELEKQLSDTLAARDKNREQLAGVEEELSGLTKRREETQATLDEAEQQRMAAMAELAPVQAEYEAARAEVDRWEEELEFVAEMSRLGNELQRVEQEAEDQETRWRELEEQAELVRRDVEQAEQAREKLAQAERQVDQQLAAARKQREEAAGRHKQQAELVAKARENAERLKSATETLATAVEKAQSAAGQAVDDELQAASKSLEKILEKKQAELAEQLKKADAEAVKAQEADEERLAAEQRVPEVEQQLEVARQEHAAGRAVVERLTARSTELEEAVAKSKSEMDQLRQRLEALEKELLAARVVRETSD